MRIPAIFSLTTSSDKKLMRNSDNFVAVTVNTLIGKHVFDCNPMSSDLKSLEYACKVTAALILSFVQLDMELSDKYRLPILLVID